MGGYQGGPADPERQEDNRAAANLQKIQHIVVLMLENRSFDHMLGYLSLPADRGGQGRTDVDGLKGLESNVLGGSAKFRVHRLRSTVFPFDPPHETPEEVRRQLGLAEHEKGDPPAMGGFVRCCREALREKRLQDEFSPGLVMGYHTGDQVPMYNLIARHFAVCDRWFCSVPSGTWPNRMFLYAGTSNGIVTNAENIVIYGPEYENMPRRLVVNLLDRRRVSWRIYKHDFSWMGLFRGFDGGERVQPFGQFVGDCREGRLPAVSFVDPNWNAFGNEDYCNDDHPPEGDVAAGQRLVAQVYEALRRGPRNLLARTLFIVTYDEHGGFYDHVLPPDVPAFGYPRRHPEALSRYGVRVPALVVSAYTPPGMASHILFDHASIVRTILLRFCDHKTIVELEGGGRRVQVARNLGVLLPLARPRTDLPSAAHLLTGGYTPPKSVRTTGPSEYAREMAEARRLAEASGRRA